MTALLRDELGYRYLGDWNDRDGNSNIEEALLTKWLQARGNTAAQIGTALHRLQTEANNHSRTLFFAGTDSTRTYGTVAFGTR